MRPFSFLNSACVSKSVRLSKAVLLLWGCGTLPALGSPTYLGLYMQGQKIGYASYKTSPVIHGGKKLSESDTHTLMDTGLLGTPIKILIDSQSFLNPDNSPVEMDFQMSSQGRSQTVVAKFGTDSVAVTVNNSGTVTKRILKRPNGPVLDDPINLVLTHQSVRKCFILDPTTVSFIENEVNVVGTKRVTDHGRQINETIVDVIDPRATTRAYLDSGGNLLHAEGPMGINMVPESEAVALSKPSKYSPTVDLAYSSCIVPQGDLPNPAGTKLLVLEVTGKNLVKTPSDEVQTLTGQGENWKITIHPPRLSEGLPITMAATQQKAWTLPDLDIPSNSPKFKTLAHKIVGSATNTTEAAIAIKNWVYSVMKPNAGIGVLRDASEILQTKEGVCRDYAILTATLLRSVGIPTRLASGLVDWDGTFYYHAWDEIWDGRHWVGIDSTTPDRQISASHVKLAQGSVADTFTFAVLDHVKIKILSYQD